MNDHPLRTRSRTRLAATAIAVTVPLLAGCAGGTTAAPGDSDVADLVVGLSQNPETLDPGATGLVGTSKVDAQIFDTLIYRAVGEDEWLPGLATDVAINDDATVYTLTLREGVTFHDGTPFTAEAVRATFDHIVDPETASLSAIGLLGPYKETRVIDDFTAEVVFSAPYPAFLNNMSGTTLGISSPAALEKWGADYGKHPTGTGPFVFESFTSDSEVKLTRNDDYEWGPEFYGEGPPDIETITFRILADGTAQSNALTTGEIHIADNLSTQDAASAESGGKTITSSPAAGMPYGYLINVDKAPTDDLAVRQAITHAVDRQTIIDTLFQGQYDVASSVVTAVTPGYSDGGDAYSYDPELAGELLDEAGWELGGDGMRSKDGDPLTIEMIDIANFGFDGISTLIQAQLAEVGITAELTSQAFPTVATTYNDGASNTASWFYWSVDPGQVQTVFTCDQIESGFNWAHYCDEEFDAAITAADATADPTDRVEAFESVFASLNDEAVFLPIYDLKVILVSSGLEGISFTPDGIPLYAGLGR